MEKFLGDADHENAAVGVIQLEMKKWNGEFLILLADLRREAKGFGDRDPRNG